MRSNKCPACPSKKEPARDKTSLTCRVQYLNDIDPFAYTTSFPDPPRPPLHTFSVTLPIDPFAYTTSFPDPPRPPLHTFSVTLPLINQLAAVHRLLNAPHRLDDAALQLYKDGDYGSYLDLEASISEQQEEFEEFQES
ncbi:Formin N-terminal GTPase-binding domain [Popillia japonica]|uniref:Formin N-terminal GTPase-binding domain n=1 Tax=Popillia japonica TaxID=7064 RepID=A0AAW1L9K8_POPJA